MSLDVYLRAVRPCTVFDANYTHNCNTMAEAAGLYEAVWRPDEHGYTTAADILPILRAGIARMKADPEKFIALNPENGWGSYETFLPWLERYADACEANPDALVEVSR